MPSEQERILVIKLGALGDFVLCFGPFKAIRDHHGGAHITVLTGPTLAELAQQSGYFDAVWTDSRPGWRRPVALWKQIRRLRGSTFDRVYDLQTAQRTTWYFRALWPRQPTWSGIAPGCALFDNNPHRNTLHEIPRRKSQLARAGIPVVPDPDLTPLLPHADALNLEQPYALLIPGASRRAKMWPLSKYIRTIHHLAARRITPVVIGAETEQVLGRACAEAGALNLVGQTTIATLAQLACRATLALGGDTGPVHVAALMGCPVVALFGPASSPTLSAPVGGRVTVLSASTLESLSTEEVFEACGQMIHDQALDSEVRES